MQAETGLSASSFPPWYWGARSPNPLPQPQRVHRHRGAHAHGALFPLELEGDAHTGGMCPQVSPGRGGPGTALCWPSRRQQRPQGCACGPRACAAYLEGPGCRKGTLSAGAGLRYLPRWEEVPLPPGNRRSSAPMLEARREVSVTQGQGAPRWGAGPGGLGWAGAGQAGPGGLGFLLVLPPAWTGGAGRCTSKADAPLGLACPCVRLEVSPPQRCRGAELAAAGLGWRAATCGGVPAVAGAVLVPLCHPALPSPPGMPSPSWPTSPCTAWPGCC